LSILADTLESVIAAVYLDGGLAIATEMVLRLLAKELTLVHTSEAVKDFKTWLQEVAQRTPDNKIIYEVVAQTGPDHDKYLKSASA